MNVLIDHLAAMLVGGVVLLLLLGLTLTSRSDAVEDARYDVNRKRARTLATLVENEVRNVGSGVPPSIAPIVSVSDSVFEFRAKENFGASALNTVRYERVGTETVRIGGVDVRTFAVERLVNGAVMQRFEGLTDVGFQLRDADGTPTVTVADAQALHVRFAVGLPPDATVDRDPRARYRRSIAMPNLGP